MTSLTETVRAGRTAEVIGLLGAMTVTERRSLFPELKALRKELRATRWNEPSRRAYPALYVAGVACQTGAAGVASWIAAADMRWSGVSPAVLLRVLADRETGWLADLANRLAQRPATAQVPYELMSALVRLADCPVPTTDAYVRGWVRQVRGNWRRGNTLLERLRTDPHLVPLVTALFEVNDIGGLLEWTSDEGPDSWHEALARLTLEGPLDRRATVDSCVARLLRGGTNADHRAFLRVLTSLALTREEQRERVADWAALASDAVSPVASHAQAVLGALALHGQLTHRHLAEVSGAVLFRPERKLVRAQLVLLGKVLARDAAGADELLPAVAQAFGHEDAGVQERALKLAQRHVKKVHSAEVRAELALAAEQLIPSLRVQAVGSLGAAPAAVATAYEEVLPPVPEPARLAPAAASVVELAEEVGAALASDTDVTGFERALDGLVRHAHRDRDALLQALEPVISRQWWDGTDPFHGLRLEYQFGGVRGGFDTSAGLDLLLATLRGKLSTATLRAAIRPGARGQTCGHDALSQAFDARLWEVAYRVRTDPLPFLLSTPTWSTGLLEPDELVERLDAYRRLGARVSAADFAQALLRVRRGDRSAAAAAAKRAAALDTAEGRRLSHWLTAGAPVLPTVRRRTSESPALVESGELPELQEDLPDAFRALGGPSSAFTKGRYCSHWSGTPRPHWPAVVPELRELVAVRVLPDLAAAAMDDTRGAASVLPLLAESGGEAGEATHLCVAYGLGARHPEDRLAAVDALLVLAARGQLDSSRLGADLGQLVRHGAVKPLRLAESLRTTASTGAYATVWALLGHALPPLLCDLAADGPAGPVRGLGDLLAVAAECAERSEARGDLPHLARAADRRGSSRLVAEARRLRGALAPEAAA
ncbi:DUF7824 domain-containing protein [Streptomyces cyslabdanicus]|uniref:DUF7824 domain-containing protein n=1 Tax=Streptomyces cyslabdanicus TaxID=1470456 RepID=UPI0040442EFC